MKKVAVVLLNLGGPDSLQSIKPFLFNLFSDPRIITVRFALVRYMIAYFISRTRSKNIQNNYQIMGGSSPLLPNTYRQAYALETALNRVDDGNDTTEYKVFVSMRYWQPMVGETLKLIINYMPDQVVLLPLYPQFSSTTTLSSFENWLKSWKTQKRSMELRLVGCYYADNNFIKSYVKLIKQCYNNIEDKASVKILFSAHSLPQKIVDLGDPYQWQVCKTVDLIIDQLGIKSLDWVITYQSKIGPVKWLLPSTEDEVIANSKNSRILLIVPIVFVSEHIETLVELDVEYKELAKINGAKGYFRVPTVGIEYNFVQCMVNNVLIASKSKSVLNCMCGPCPVEFGLCCRNSLDVDGL